jgi:hypothetical protein
MRREGLALHAIDQRSAVERRHGNCQGGFGEAVDRQVRFLAKAVAGKPRRKALHRFRIDRLGAVHGDTPGTQIEPFDVLVGNLAHAQLVRKIGRRGDRAVVLVKRPQPAFRAGEESQRRDHGERHAEVQKREPRSDQSHVVVEGKPTNAHVARPHLHGGADGADVGQEIRVGQHHAFRVAGRTGGVLQESDIARTARAAAHHVGRQGSRRGRGRLVRSSDQLFCIRHSSQRTHARFQQVGDRFRAAKSQQQAHFCVVQDRRLPRSVFLDPVRAKWRINRHRNRAGQENAGVGNKKRPRGGKHQRHAPPRGYAPAREFGRTTLPGSIELAKSQRDAAFLDLGILGDQQMGAIGIMRGAIAQQVEQRLRGKNSRVGGFALQPLRADRGA